MSRVLAVALLVQSLGCAALRPRAAESAYPALFVLVTPDGQRLSRSALVGRPVLVQFMATWCFGCLAELSVLEKLRTSHAAEGLQIVLVGMDLEGRKVLEPFAALQPLPGPLLVADESVLSGTGPFGHIRAVPTSFLFDREGSLRAAWQGATSFETVESALR